MKRDFSQWVRKNYGRVVHSIAFYPAILVIGFLLLSVFSLELDASEFGKHIKSKYSWVQLQDTGTARTILATIAGGIISLTVFSFSMVMIVLNQAASQMSNRMLDSMIGNRFQQTVLGFYIGSIVYALFLLSTIREMSSGIYVPALSIYFSVFLTIISIFLFIYFLHYVTQSVKYNTIIERIHHETYQSLKRYCTETEEKKFVKPEKPCQTIGMPRSDYFQGFDEKEVLRFASEHDVMIEFLHPSGTYLLKDVPFMNIYGDKKLSTEETESLMLLTDLFGGHPIEKNPYYGYHQLAEVAIKALSPGINDPQTAVLSLHALSDLLSYRLHHFEPTVYVDENDTQRICTVSWTFMKLFQKCVYVIWDYGKNDRYIQGAMLKMTEQLLHCDTERIHTDLLSDFLQKVKDQTTQFALDTSLRTEVAH